MMKQAGYKTYGTISGILIILYMVSGFAWGQAGYAVPTMQGAATIALGAAFCLCSIRCSILVPAAVQAEEENSGREEIRREAKLA